MVEISQNFVAFSEYMNFTEFVILDTFMKQGKIVSRMEEFQKDFF